MFRRSFRFGRLLLLALCWITVVVNLQDSDRWYRGERTLMTWWCITLGLATLAALYEPPAAKARRPRKMPKLEQEPSDS